MLGDKQLHINMQFVYVLVLIDAVVLTSFSFVLLFFRDNFLVLDIFFEALNYETIEQKKAYDVAGLLGRYFVSHHTISACGYISLCIPTDA